MTHSNYDMKPLKELVKVLNGGVEFYKDAKEKVDDEHICAIFNTIITEKVQAISTLQTYVLIDEGERETNTNSLVKLREHYTQVLGGLSSDKTHTYIAQLEEVEDKVLNKISDALEQALPPQCVQDLRQVQVRMQACHNEMKALQELTA
ncbi:PA2169 family four-helix-bundle protein [Pseudoalteromonas rubra]|uniref:DUF2383 domain-containing protein n=1 Tax=Pseudoalteromonas rubra TaxID=43658 RepID=A0A5S3X2Q6_9GAMM|nr:PA2169 family four-helix-bundle protein [Pseudoalteromonas rubra]TMP38443.1 hypothetical protein CWB98_06850 [Pseudoalteromonas rubra]